MSEYAVERWPRAARDVRRAPGIWWLRLHVGVRGRALRARRACYDAVRGHERGAAHGHRSLPGGGMTIQKPRTAKQDWLDNVYGPAVKKRPERRARFTTISGDTVEPLYTPDDVLGFDAQRDLGAPGEFPYTRGIHPSMYRGRLWTMRQFAGFGSAEDTNERFHYLLQ